MRIRTIKMVLIAFSAIGFGLFTVPVLGNLYLKQRFGLDAFQRGLIGTIGSAGVLIALATRRAVLRPPLPQGPGAGALAHRQGRPSVRRPRPDSVLHAERGPVGDLQRPDRGPPSHRLLHDRPGPHLGGSLSPARDWSVAVGGIYVFFVGATGGAVLAALLDSVVGVRATVLIIMIPSTIFGAFMIIRSAHFIRQRPVPRGGRAPGGNGGAQAPRGRSRADPGPAAEQRRLQLRARPDPLRRQLRGETGRGARTPRDQRGREVDVAQRRRRPGDRVPRRGPAERSRYHLHDAGAALAARHPSAAGRQGRLRSDDRGGEPRDGRLRLPLGSRRAPPPDGTGLRALPGPQGSPRRASRLALWWTAADARVGDRHAARPRSAHDRRTVPRPRPDHRPRAHRGRRRAEGGRRDADHRRAVPERGGRHRRQGRLPREGPCALRGPDPRPDGTGRPGAGGVPRGPGRR